MTWRRARRGRKRRRARRRREGVDAAPHRAVPAGAGPLVLVQDPDGGPRELPPGSHEMRVPPVKPAHRGRIGRGAPGTGRDPVRESAPAIPARTCRASQAWETRRAWEEDRRSPSRPEVRAGRCTRPCRETPTNCTPAAENAPSVGGKGWKRPADSRGQACAEAVCAQVSVGHWIAGGAWAAAPDSHERAEPGKIGEGHPSAHLTGTDSRMRASHRCLMRRGGPGGREASGTRPPKRTPLMKQTGFQIRPSG